VSWFTSAGETFAGFTAGYGVNAGQGWRRQAGFAEFTREWTSYSISARAEVLQVDPEVLGVPPDSSDAAEAVVGALTAGFARRLGIWHGFDVAVGGQVTWNAVPGSLTGAYGSHPISGVALLRLRLPTGPMGRMWNMRLTSPVSQGMDMSHMMHMAPGKDDQ
jgi:hypothetical protein